MSKNRTGLSCQIVPALTGDPFPFAGCSCASVMACNAGDTRAAITLLGLDLSRAGALCAAQSGAQRLVSSSTSFWSGVLGLQSGLRWTQRLHERPCGPPQTRVSPPAHSRCSSENNESVITASMLWLFLLEEGRCCSGDVIRLWIVSELYSCCQMQLSGTVRPWQPPESKAAR